MLALAKKVLDSILSFCYYCLNASTKRFVFAVHGSVSMNDRSKQLLSL